MWKSPHSSLQLGVECEELRIQNIVRGDVDEVENWLGLQTGAGCTIFEKESL